MKVFYMEGPLSNMNEITNMESIISNIIFNEKGCMLRKLGKCIQVNANECVFENGTVPKCHYGRIYEFTLELAQFY